MFNLLYMLFLFLNFITFSFNLNNFNNNIDSNTINKLPKINNKYYTKITFPFIGIQEIEYLQYTKFKSKITLNGIIKQHGYITYNINELDDYIMDQSLIDIINKYNCIIEEPLYNYKGDYISLKLYIKLIKFTKKIKLKRII